MSTAPFSVSARALRDDIRHTRKLSLGCAVLDRALGGGVDVQGLTEVAGSAGAGKTQLVLRCLLHVQLPPSEGGLSAERWDHLHLLRGLERALAATAAGPGGRLRRQSPGAP
jgi:RecA/RadA recombinase